MAPMGSRQQFQSSLTGAPSAACRRLAGMTATPHLHMHANGIRGHQGHQGWWFPQWSQLPEHVVHQYWKVQLQGTTGVEVAHFHPREQSVHTVQKLHRSLRLLCSRLLLPAHPDQHSITPGHTGHARGTAADDLIHGCIQGGTTSPSSREHHSEQLPCCTCTCCPYKTITVKHQQKTQVLLPRGQWATHLSCKQHPGACAVGDHAACT